MRILILSYTQFHIYIGKVNRNIQAYQTMKAVEVEKVSIPYQISILRKDDLRSSTYDQNTTRQAMKHK